MSQPPFELGDRVGHAKIGLASVCEPPEGGPIVWKVTIRPDDPDLTVKTIIHARDPKARFLKLISSPDCKGERYWRLKYEDLVAAAEEIRQRKTLFLRQSFRSCEPGDFLSKLKDLQSEEAVAEEEIAVFIKDDEDGKHP
ncbi:hypothetical protein [Sulfitobacter sp. R18_1]|uniref:hypothetical protein n=1 Tax=Sulfitobacter sp. R18_1 TaxID=2821104 RepID=UPI001AD9F512|nr:hypothetical protein [Sulfitobacter sp. R18_1]MBO9428200.1 hypothetical protein [Sulfitobacter sp. R18_1]